MDRISAEWVLSSHKLSLSLDVSRSDSQIKNIFVIFEPCKLEEIDAQNTLQRHKRQTLLIKNLEWCQSRTLCNMSMQILNAPGDGSMQPQTKVY